MLTEKMVKALNFQMNAELYSSYLYMSMAAYFNQVNLSGMARWMEIQAIEEMSHGLKFYKFINERGGRAVMAAIEAPPSEWENPLAVFEAVLSHEQKVTGLINDLVDLAISEKDHATNNFLQWFVAEQVEEEASADEVVQKMKLTQGDSSGLFMIDQEMNTRVFTTPPEWTIFA